VSTENDIAAAIMGDLDPEVAVDRIGLQAAVELQLTDNETGALLDVRRAVLLTVTIEGKRPVMEVFDAARFDTLAARYAAVVEANPEVSITIADGRLLFAQDA
jgi:hypothetical protein